MGRKFPKKKLDTATRNQQKSSGKRSSGEKFSAQNSSSQKSSSHPSETESHQRSRTQTPIDEEN